MATCTRERVMAGLETQLTTYMVAKYGAGYLATRDLGSVPEQTMPESTPRLWIWEQTSELYADSSGHEFRKVHAVIIGLIRPTTSTIDTTIASQLNELEAVIDQVLFVDTLGTATPYSAGPPVVPYAPAVKVEIFPDGPCEFSPGDAEGWLWYPVRIHFARLG